MVRATGLPALASWMTRSSEAGAGLARGRSGTGLTGAVRTVGGCSGWRCAAAHRTRAAPRSNCKPALPAWLPVRTCRRGGPRSWCRRRRGASAPNGRASGAGGRRRRTTAAGSALAQHQRGRCRQHQQPTSRGSDSADLAFSSPSGAVWPQLKPAKRPRRSLSAFSEAARAERRAAARKFSSGARVGEDVGEIGGEGVGRIGRDVEGKACGVGGREAVRRLRSGKAAGSVRRRLIGRAARRRAGLRKGLVRRPERRASGRPGAAAHRPAARPGRSLAAQLAHQVGVILLQRIQAMRPSPAGCHRLGRRDCNSPAGRPCRRPSVRCPSRRRSNAASGRRISSRAMESSSRLRLSSCAALRRCFSTWSLARWLALRFHLLQRMVQRIGVELGGLFRPPPGCAIQRPFVA